MMGLIGLLIVGIILYFLFKNKDLLNANQKSDSSLELLKQRYIKGEIDEEQYQKMLEVLKH
ncbi:SHOCT domain-containing protein [Eubacteriaceae bacterium ES3]|nr:SHOCT domain-containing protein [Eubacteriaceae bacterium ES3]